MQIRIPRIKVRATIVTLLLLCGCVSNNQHIMNTELQIIGAKLSTFSQSKQPANVRTALDHLDNIPNANKAGKIDVEIRRQKTQTALRILRAVQDAKDSSFNTNDLPNINTPPPPETGLPSGVSPQAIKDPKLRAQYETDIAANEKRIAYSNQETTLRHLENEVYQRILNYLASSYPRNSESRAELSHLATEAGIAKEFREAIQAKMK